MAKLDKNKTGLVVGCFFALVHAVRALLILLIPNQLQLFLNWIFNIHMMEPVFVLTAFNWISALMLIVTTFIIGYIVGYVFSAVNNLIIKK